MGVEMFVSTPIFVTKICYALTYRGGIPLILCNFVFSKNF